jgi:hypothetical protein
MADRNLHDIVREVVVKNRPDEETVFEDLYQDSLADPHAAAADAAPGASAMGVEIVAFLTPILVSVLSDVAKDALGAGLRFGAKRLWNRITHHTEVPADTAVALTSEQIVAASAALARKLRLRGYGQAEIDQICRDLTAAAAPAH